jgi:hypothetical protein
MLQFIYDRGIGIAWGALAMAAQVSGYNNTAIALFFVAVAAFFFLAPVWHHSLAWHRRREVAGLKSLEPFHLIMGGLVGLIVFGLVALAGVFWHFNRQPLVDVPKPSVEVPKTDEVRKADTTPTATPSVAALSDFEWGFERHPGYDFIGMSAGPDGQLLVHQFQAQGFNRTKDPMVKFRGWVRSERTTKEFPILFNLADGIFRKATELDPIPVDAIIDTRAYLSEDQKPISLKSFLADFVPFTFFFEYDGKLYRHKFTIEDIEPRIQRYEQEIRRASVRPPQMSVKKTPVARIEEEPSSPSPAPPVSDEGPLKWFMNLMMEGGPLMQRNVFTLQFRGINDSKKPVQLKDAYILSPDGKTQKPLEIVVANEIAPLEHVGPIPPQAQISLVAKFGPPAPEPGKILGIDAKEFLASWSSFTLVVVDNFREYRVPFTEQYLMPFFPGMLGPQVTKKADTNEKQQ